MQNNTDTDINSAIKAEGHNSQLQVIYLAILIVAAFILLTAFVAITVCCIKRKKNKGIEQAKEEDNVELKYIESLEEQKKSVTSEHESVDRPLIRPSTNNNMLPDINIAPQERQVPQEKESNANKVGYSLSSFSFSNQQSAARAPNNSLAEITPSGSKASAIQIGEVQGFEGLRFSESGSGSLPRIRRNETVNLSEESKVDECKAALHQNPSATSFTSEQIHQMIYGAKAA